MSEISLYPMTESKEVLVDARSFPILCPKCDYLFPDLFHHKSSRYGYVGSVNCQCGEEITISDNDHEFITSITLKSKKAQRIYNFKELYRFPEGNILRIKRQYKLDAFQEFADQKVRLEDFITAIERANKLTVTPIETTFPLPLPIKKWFSLIDARNVRLPKSFTH